jgi:hypothetical protein
MVCGSENSTNTYTDEPVCLWSRRQLSLLSKEYQSYESRYAMKRTNVFLRISLIATLCLIAMPLPALAVGEVFRVNTSGTEYCGDFDAQKFNSKSAVPLWVRIDSDTQITVSLSAGFLPDTTFPMFGYFYQTKANSAAFVAGVAFEDGAYVTLQGSAKIDTNTGEVTQLRGVFIQNSVIYVGCFSSGAFSTAKP